MVRDMQFRNPGPAGWGIPWIVIIIDYATQIVNSAHCPHAKFT